MPLIRWTIHLPLSGISHRPVSEGNMSSPSTAATKDTFSLIMFVAWKIRKWRKNDVFGGAQTNGRFPCFWAEPRLFLGAMPSRRSWGEASASLQICVGVDVLAFCWCVGVDRRRALAERGMAGGQPSPPASFDGWSNRRRGIALGSSQIRSDMWPLSSYAWW
jgi:hypothetical protein